ncbi:hypothetical protein Hanom_Chr15g01337371 [Helianthus anomalus]
MLETYVGLRDLLISNNYLMRLGWIEGWDRWLAMNKWWPNVRSSYSEGFGGNLGWDMPKSLMMLDPGSSAIQDKEAEKWLHQIGRIWRSKLLYVFSVWARGIFVIMGWVCASSVHIKMGLKSQFWFYVWLAKRYSCTRDMQFNQCSADTPWAYTWVRVCWVGIVVGWKLYKLVGECRQTILWYWYKYKLSIKQVIIVVRSRGNCVLLGWFIYTMVVLVGLRELIELWCNGVCKCSDLLSRVPRLLVGQFGLKYQPPGWFRHDLICYLAAQVCCMVGCSGYSALVFLMGIAKRFEVYLTGLVLCWTWSWKVNQLGLYDAWVGLLMTQIWMLGNLDELGCRPTSIRKLLIRKMYWAALANCLAGLSRCLLGPGSRKNLKAHFGCFSVSCGSRDKHNGRLNMIIRSHRFWSRLPCPNRHFCKVFQQCQLGFCASVMVDIARYFCTPKRGRMISYFWSPRYVSGIVQGYAPLRL